MNVPFNLSNVPSKLSDPTEKLIEFESKYNKLYSYLQISRNFNAKLMQRITQPERNVLTDSLYYRRKQSK